MTPSATLTAADRRATGGAQRRDGASGADAAVPETASARRGGGPQDRALYQCACGNAFTASVSTSVGCPQCGSRQAW